MARKAIIAIIGVVAAVLVCAVPAAAQQGGGTWVMGPGMMEAGFGARGMMGGGFGMMSQYPDGYVAFLKAELNITSAQESVWAPFAKAIRDSAAANRRLGPGMMRGAGPTGPGMMQGAGGPAMMRNAQGWQPQPLPDALDRQVEWTQSRLDSLKAMRDAAKPLYAKLSDEQKAKTDRLLGCCAVY